MTATAQKADFDDVYVQPDPRAYYETLRSFDYEIPEHGRTVFDAVLAEMPATDATPTVLDICCSYGINAALLNHEVTLDEVEAHYAEAGDLSRPKLIARDRDFFGAQRRAEQIDVVGLDISGPAIDYAVEAGLLTDGIVADLENDTLAPVDAAKIADVDLVTITGGVGYVKERTFDQILEAAETLPWVAVLSLRWVDFEPIAETLDSHGLITEKLDGFVVPQRRFVDDGEQDFVMAQLADRGLETTPVEDNGQHGAELYVARPVPEVAATPLTDALAALDVSQGTPG